MMNTPKSPDHPTSSKSVAVTPDGPGKASNEIVEPNDNDVLCGRGGSVNSHPGNEFFRILVEQRKRVYLTARFKREKRLIAEGIVNEIRALNPPGRFLAKESKSSNWHAIDFEKARDKTSQALRENAPKIRAKIETEINRQRAEMQRAEEEEAARAAHYHQQQSWGGYFSSYYYGAPPGPSPTHQQGYDHQGAYEGGWNHAASPQHYEQQHQGQNSAFDSWTAWTKNFSSGGSPPQEGGGEGSDHHRTQPQTPQSSYQPQYPEPSTPPRYYDESNGHQNGYNGQAMPFSPVVTSGGKARSDEEMMDTDNTVEPHSEGMDLDGERHDSSLLTQVANHILTSWDTSAICAQGSTELDDTSWWGKSPSATDQNKADQVKSQDTNKPTPQYGGDEEVQVMDVAEVETVSDEETRMPPPQDKEMGWPAPVSCQWIPESFSSSGFFGPKGSFDSPMSPVGSGNMGSGEGTTSNQHQEGYPCGGGDSLCNGFRHDTLPVEPAKHTTAMDDSSEFNVSMDHKVLSTIPSWENGLGSQESNPVADCET